MSNWAMHASQGREACGMVEASVPPGSRAHPRQTRKSHHKGTKNTKNKEEEELTGRFTHCQWESGVLHSVSLSLAFFFVFFVPLW